MQLHQITQTLTDTTPDSFCATFTHLLSKMDVSVPAAFLTQLVQPILFEQTAKGIMTSNTNAAPSGFERTNLLLLAILFDNNCRVVERQLAAAELEAKQAQQQQQPTTENVPVPVTTASATTAVASKAQLDDVTFTIESGMSTEAREMTSVRNWLSCLGLTGISLSSNANTLARDFKDGVILLKIADALIEGCVDWRKVEKKPDNKFKCVSNCNYFISLATSGSLFGFSLVGVGGVDIYDGNMKYLLSILAQLMRFQTMKKLKDVKRKMTKFRTNTNNSKNQDLNDEAILSWANQKVSGNIHPSVSSFNCSRISSFHDSSLTHSLYLLNLLHAIKADLVQWQLVELPPSTQPGSNNIIGGITRFNNIPMPTRVGNARYFLSLARKLGADIFCTPLDIVECKQNSILLILATLMTIEMEMNLNN